MEGEPAPASATRYVFSIVLALAALSGLVLCVTVRLGAAVQTGAWASFGTQTFVAGIVAMIAAVKLVRALRALPLPRLVRRIARATLVGALVLSTGAFVDCSRIQVTKPTVGRRFAPPVELELESDYGVLGFGVATTIVLMAIGGWLGRIRRYASR